MENNEIVYCTESIELFDTGIMLTTDANAHPYTAGYRVVVESLDVFDVDNNGTISIIGKEINGEKFIWIYHGAFLVKRSEIKDEPED